MVPVEYIRIENIVMVHCPVYGTEDDVGQAVQERVQAVEKAHWYRCYCHLQQDHHGVDKMEVHVVDKRRQFLIPQQHRKQSYEINDGNNECHVGDDGKHEPIEFNVAGQRVAQVLQVDGVVGAGSAV